MRVIICGAGLVGYGIAERLAAENNDVTIIDTKPTMSSASISLFSVHLAKNTSAPVDDIMTKIYAVILL